MMESESKSPTDCIDRLHCDDKEIATVLLPTLQEWFSVGEDALTYGAFRRRAHRGSERSGSVVRPQDGYSPEILSPLSS